MTATLPIVSYERAAKRFEKLVPLTKKAFLRRRGEARARAFTIATVTRMNVLRDFKGALATAMRDGTPLADFQQAAAEIAARRGWAGTTPWHMELVFRNATQFSYGFYRLEEHLSVADAYPFAEYDDVFDDRERAHHRALHRRIFRVGSAAYRRYYGPWEHACRCSMTPLSEDEIGRRKIEDDNFNVGVEPGDDFEGPGYGFKWEPDLSGFTAAERREVEGALAKGPRRRR